MTGNLTSTKPGVTLSLADGQRWSICPVDDRAAAIVAELGRVMRLGPGRGGRALFVAVQEESGIPSPEAGGAVVCRLATPADRDAEIAQMRRVVSQIAREVAARGGMLFHGALAEYRGIGFIMAGPSSVGKSTASRRLPPPWRSLSDDMTLVVRDDKGVFWAHPWPTWSQFLYGGTGGTWEVENAVPLRAVFFLDQATADSIEPIQGTRVTALAVESAEEIAREVLFTMTDEDVARTLCLAALNAAKSLVATIPTYALKFSLTGRFWEFIEPVLRRDGAPESGPGRHRRIPASVEAVIPSDTLRVVCTGMSMIPTLEEPDLLEVEPYGAASVRPGDVVCFKSPDADKTIAHRVVAAGPDGIRTRGDNNPADDVAVLSPDAIIGRVKAAQRGARRRTIAGGRRGLWGLWWTRLIRGVWGLTGLVPHRLYCFAVWLGPFQWVLPGTLRPRLVRFGTRYRPFLKLLMGRRAVGHYDVRIGMWRIRRPFRLFVRESALNRALDADRPGEPT